MGASVQFVGKNAVLKAFGKLDYSRWSLWPNSKDMLTSHSGGDITDSTRELEDWLDMIRNNTTGIFTLKLYDKSVKDIKPSTPNVYAINFRLVTEEDQRMGSVGGGGSIDRFLEKMDQRFDKLDTRLKQIEDGGDGEEPIKPWERMLENPVIMAGLGKMFGLDISKLPAAEKISGVPASSIEDSLAILEKNDPDFANGLAKLAALSQNNPKQYKFLRDMLNQMKV